MFEEKKYIISKEIDLIDEIYRNIEDAKTVAELLMGDHDGGDFLRKNAAGLIYAHADAARKGFDKLREINKPAESKTVCGIA